MTLTLEQILARSLRLPARRVPKSLFQPPPQAAGPPRFHPTAAPTSASDAELQRQTIRRLAAAEDKEDASSRSNKNLFGVIPAASHRTIRNSQDLLAHLNAAQRFGGWVDALTAFTQGLESKITANIAHLGVAMRTCVAADALDALRALLANESCGALSDRQAACTQAVGLLCASKGSDAGLELLAQLPPPIRSTEAYNECLSLLSKHGEWETCLSLVASMHGSVVRADDAKSNGLDASSTTVTSSGSRCGSSSNANEREQWMEAVKTVSPNAVSYAALISALQETGKKDLALEILLRLPSEMREIIVTSTVALIHVWSQQRNRRRRPPFS